MLQCCNACTWTNISSSYKIQRNYKGLKITAYMHSWGKFWTKDIKRPKKPNCHFLMSHEQKQGVGSKSRVLCMPSAHSTTKGWTNHLSHPSSATPWTHSYRCPHIRNELASPFGERSREPVNCSRSRLLQQGPQ